MDNYRNITEAGELAMKILDALDIDVSDEKWSEKYGKLLEILQDGLDEHCEHYRRFIKYMLESNEEVENDSIEDGFGSRWDKTCPECGFKTMCVVRPGKVQCNFCG